ncbi:kumamolisin [Mesorhizobium huakuii]|uniref:S53 family peptidase n=1 Tax=Mesorhizobium huakuii TaxID=28104 RepID=UPI00235C14D7|nr:S53 family peptidase [Mesorhizobium huakuii]GLQ82764.1 kumamolisin [Mesorhizobium huakuii]
MVERKMFPDSVVTLPSEGTHQPLGLVVNAVDGTQPDEPLTIHFSFEMPKGVAEKLEALVAKGQTISPAEFEKYDPKASSVQALQTWLKEQGFAILHVASDGIYARAPTSVVAKSLAVDFVRVTRDGFTHNAARNVPSLPAKLAKDVRAIGGLQPFLRAHRNSRRRSPSAANRVSLGRPVVGFTAQVQTESNKPPYMVSEILAAYGASELGVTGAGQTIAILIDTLPDDADLTAFWAANGLPQGLSRIEPVNVKEGPLDAPEGEETLDVEWASGIAPGATIRIYASGSLSFVDLDQALDRIIADLPSRPGMRQLSISLGLGETYLGGPNGEVATQHQKFLRLAAAGVNVFVSSGDAGSNPDQTGHSSGGPTQAEYASSDSMVIGVGGTSLQLRADGTVQNEVGWANSGGGKSRFFDRPQWQKQLAAAFGDRRLVPDVSITADPDFGAFLVLGGKVVQIGGTSWSAPVWAGICALLNEAMQKAGKPALPFLPPLLYPLAGSDAFGDITQGSNGLYEAHQGYDQVTGLGVPNVRALMSALVNPPAKNGAISGKLSERQRSVSRKVSLRAAVVPKYSSDIRPLFRDVDIKCMRKRNILLDDPAWMCVPANAANVYDALSSDFMPPDEPWSADKKKLFNDWMLAGYNA